MNTRENIKKFYETDDTPTQAEFDLTWDSVFFLLNNTLDDIQEGAVKKTVTQAMINKINSIEENAEQNLTPSEIVSAIDSQLGSTAWKTLVTTEYIQDQVSPLINHENHIGINVTYSDGTNEMIFSLLGEVFSTTLKNKLTGIEEGAQVNTVNSVASKTGDVVLNADDISDTSTSNKFITAALLTKLTNIEDGATADLTGLEIIDLIDLVIGTDWKTSSSAPVDSVNGQTGAVSLDPDDLDDTSTTHKFVDQALIDKVGNIESNATADQSGAEIVSAIDTELGSTGWKQKLTQEEVQDMAAALLNHSDHTNITASYNNAANKVILAAAASSPSGDSYLDQHWRTPFEYEDVSKLGTTLASNTQTGASYKTLNDASIGLSLSALQNMFSNVPEVQAATALTDFAIGGTGDPQGVSADYAVLQQLMQDHYCVWLAPQRRYMMTHTLIYRTGVTLQGMVDRDDINGSILYRANGANCDILQSANVYNDSVGGWAISGALRCFGIYGNSDNNTSGSGIVIKGYGETFAIDRVRSNWNPDDAVRLVDRIAPAYIHNLSCHRNGGYGFNVTGATIENKEIFLNTITGDANYLGTIGINAPGVSMTAINIKQEGDQLYVVDVGNASNLQLTIQGGSVSAYDIDLAGNGPNCDSVIRVNYNNGDSGFKNPVIKVHDLNVDPDWPHFLENVVTAKVFDYSNNEYFNDIKWSRWTDKLMPESQLRYGEAYYGTSVPSSLTFYHNAAYHHIKTNTITINNYVAWNVGTTVRILVKAATKPSVSSAGSAPGTPTVVESGTFAANTYQEWEITYWGVDAGNAVYLVHIKS